MYTHKVKACHDIWKVSSQYHCFLYCLHCLSCIYFSKRNRLIQILSIQTGILSNLLFISPVDSENHLSPDEVWIVFFKFVHNFLTSCHTPVFIIQSAIEFICLEINKIDHILVCLQCIQSYKDANFCHGKLKKVIETFFI